MEKVINSDMQNYKTFAEQNFNFVELCTDRCVDKNYKDFDFNDDQRKCLKNCYNKVKNLITFAGSNLDTIVSGKI